MVVARTKIVEFNGGGNRGEIVGERDMVPLRELCDELGS